MKNKAALIISVVVLIGVLAGGFLLVKNLTQKAPPSETEEEEVVELPPADPAIEVNLEPKSDGKAVILTVTKIPSGTESVEYELSYLTGAGLPKGALGKISINGTTSINREILLGTCSRNVCTYDEGVTSVKLVLRFNHPDGDTQFSKDYDLK